MKIAVIDAETDPFKFQRIPKPFAWEFYSDERTEVFWGVDCTEKLIAFLSTLGEPHMIFAHNGGKFDFHFLIDWIENPIKIINARIVSAKLGIHTLRDSFAILPSSLEQMGGKMETDYALFEEELREDNKAHILEYLHRDCLALYSKVAPFVERFGPRLTIGQTAMAEIQSRYSFIKIQKETDEIFRPFYYGGRVQCLKSGILEGPWKLYDVNSMYPHVMKSKKHPINGAFFVTDEMPDNFDLPFFLKFEGTNKGALPIKTKDGLSFGQRYGEFLACSHEIEVALKYDLITIDRVTECYVAEETITFEDYIDYFYTERQKAKENGDDAWQLFCKLLMNSAYGKFGQNPDDFEDWILTRGASSSELAQKGYECRHDAENFELWSRPARVKDSGYFDVSVAASVTSAARAILLDAMQNAVDPIYMDTDSIICRDLSADLDTKRLGAWKLEMTADTAAIGGKKLYALFDKGAREPKKIATKGGRMSLSEIKRICSGETILRQNDAPTFSLKKKPSFIERNFRMTIDDEEDFIV